MSGLPTIRELLTEWYDSKRVQPSLRLTRTIFSGAKCIFRVRMACVGCMQFKRVLVFSLSALLLCVSASASVCELSCSLSHLNPVSEPTVGASATQAHETGISQTSAPHSHCGHAHTARPGTAANRNVEDISQCSDRSCAQAHAFSRVNRLYAAQRGSAPLAVLASVPTVAPDVQFGTAKHEYALTKFLALDPLSVSLRI